MFKWLENAKQSGLISLNVSVMRMLLMLSNNLFTHTYILQISFSFKLLACCPIMKIKGNNFFIDTVFGSGCFKAGDSDIAHSSPTDLDQAMVVSKNSQQATQQDNIFACSPFDEDGTDKVEAECGTETNISLFKGINVVPKDVSKARSHNFMVVFYICLYFFFFELLRNVRTISIKFGCSLLLVLSLAFLTARQCSCQAK